ncbi:MAG: RdgB/HAM1 family non-canonical purine NTP pyrophosphatase [Caulobacterales bacterium]|nr:RdgB/HAM1 family non-canonical purine NTP pyrophosphatase [Caulobacterales bacterium]
MKPRLTKGSRLVVATHNPGKAREIAALLGGDFEVLSADQAGVPEPEETESTFIGNAVLKARHAALTSGQPALADDSGLSVRSLAGQPGIYSARWAGPTKDFSVAMARVEQELAGATDRSAFFTCALAVAWPDGSAFAVEGIVEGDLVFPPRGTRGFGYDPIFVPRGGRETFGEMDPLAKEAISHRTRAFAQLRAALID